MLLKATPELPAFAASAFVLALAAAAAVRPDTDKDSTGVLQPQHRLTFDFGHQETDTAVHLLSQVAFVLVQKNRLQGQQMEMQMQKLDCLFA